MDFDFCHVWKFHSLFFCSKFANQRRFLLIFLYASLTRDQLALFSFAAHFDDHRTSRIFSYFTIGHITQIVGIQITGAAVAVAISTSCYGFAFGCFDRFLAAPIFRWMCFLREIMYSVCNTWTIWVIGTCGRFVCFRVVFCARAIASYYGSCVFVDRKRWPGAQRWFTFTL